MTRYVTFLGERCRVERGHYENGRVAIQLVCLDGEVMATATINLPGYWLNPDEAFIKDYSENAGMLVALTAAGVVRDTGRRVHAGFATVPVVRVLE